MNKEQLEIIINDCHSIIKRVGNDFNKLQGKKILITGSSGMLASYFLDTINVLNECYFKVPCKVIAMIHSPLLNYKRLEHLRNNPNIKFITQDISKSFDINEDVDYIIHAASKASPKYYLNDTLDTIYANLNGLKTILEYSTNNSVKSILYFSSGEIYGNPDEDNIPTSEVYEGKVLCTGPRACYTETKRFCETLLMNYVINYKIHAKIVRPWHVFGPGMKLNDGRVIADFISNGLNGEDIKILSSGLATRTFCYITDAHVGFWKLLFSNYDGEAFNIGNDNPEISVRELASLMCKLFGNNINYILKKQNDAEYLNNAPLRCCPNIDKAKKLLNYNPEEKLEEWLLKMIRWYQIGVKQYENN
ncbi:NAD-dependent epimerase/dehydratase family protein [Clostridium sp. A1-XYC3]|uniref:NAD-dependent epimerase/dehydratase family protein n=1 Tax=Clostridium tanneri TaxID=3037988 RepID=A0ABU4JNK5_9CLOT|nr:NAD-dependent epimerase/dehydratase family protein [Clostridium sp. A1-XYC3]MDW8799690.1 NAD-dependent epimerase/dehydratase family protein [Clostridium sp. A1-XYC3]